MPGHRLGDLVECLSAGRAAEIEDGEAIGRGPGLQEALLQGFPKGMDAILPLSQVAQAIEKLTVVGRQDHDLGVVAAQDRLF
ncbi:hypothetical protein D3C86_1169880 [compost metagenome]